MMDDLNTLWSKLLSDYAQIKNKATKLSGGYQAFIDAAAALIRQCYGALSSLTDNEYTVDGGTPFTQIDVITELVTESGPIVSIDNKLRGQSIERLIVDIDPVQSGSGDPSPDNVRPITGWDGVKVTRTGKNVFPSKGLTQTLNGITIRSNSDGSFTVNGTATANAQFDLTLNNELKLQAGQYTVGMFADKTVTFDSQHVWWFFYNMDAHADIVNCRTPSKTFSLNKITSTRFYLRIISGATVDNVTLYPMLVYGSDAPTEFEPYNGNTYDISLSDVGTVYGGTLDVVSGVLTVDKRYEEFTGASSENWQYLTGSFGARCGIVRNSVLNTGNRVDVVANKGMFSASANTVGTVFASGVSIYYYPPETVTSVEGFKSWLASNPLQVVYALATPLTYQLTQQEIAMLLGRNNIWSTAGDVTVTYPAKSDKDCNGGYPGS